MCMVLLYFGGVWCKDGDVKESMEMGDSDSFVLVLVWKG